MEQVATIIIWRPGQDIPGINGFFGVKNAAPDGAIDARIVQCAACEGAPGRWEYDGALDRRDDCEEAEATIRWIIE